MVQGAVHTVHSCSVQCIDLCIEVRSEVHLAECLCSVLGRVLLQCTWQSAAKCGGAVEVGAITGTHCHAPIGALASFEPIPIQ